VGDGPRPAPNPRPPQRPGPGVARDEIDAEAAIAACRAAVAAAPGVARLAYQLGRALDAADDYPEAAEWYRRAGEAGSATARVSLGNMYETGEGVAQDYARAAALYRSGMPDDPWSFGALGYLTEEGLGVPQDLAAAMALYQKGFATGDAWSAMKIGRMLELGRGRAVDLPAAMGWYERAAEGGDATGMFNAGVFYDRGMGVPADAGKAVAYYRRAVAAGNTDAMLNLGYMYQDGRGVPQDTAEAERLWRDGSDEGDPMAQNALAWLWAEQGRNLDAALDLVDEALDSMPDDASTLDTRGWILFRLGRTDEAITAMKSALAQKGDTDRAVFLDHLGDIYAARGQADAARLQWQAAQQADPAPELAASLERKLAPGSSAAGQ
jgi:TPR repeat protein